MANNYKSKQYQETGIPNRPPIKHSVKTDARPDVDGVPDGPATGPAKPEEKEKLIHGTGPAADKPTGPAAE